MLQKLENTRQRMNSTKINPKQTLLASIAKARNYKWDEGKLYTLDTNELVSEDAHEISKHLLGQTATVKTLESLESIVDYIIKLPAYETLIAEAKEAGLNFPDQKSIEEYKPGSGAWFRRMIEMIK